MYISVEQCLIYLQLVFVFRRIVHANAQRLRSISYFPYTPSGFLKCNFLFVLYKTSSPVTDLEVVQTGLSTRRRQQRRGPRRVGFIVNNIMLDYYNQLMCFFFLRPVSVHLCKALKRRGACNCYPGPDRDRSYLRIIVVRVHCRR